MKKVIMNKNKFRVLFLTIMPTLTKELSVMELVIAIIRSIEDACITVEVRLKVRKINI